jgi:hypothetical protein
VVKFVPGLPRCVVDKPVTFEDVFAAREVPSHHRPVRLSDIHAQKLRVLLLRQAKMRLMHALDSLRQCLARYVQVRQHQQPRPVFQ